MSKPDWRGCIVSYSEYKQSLIDRINNLQIELAKLARIEVIERDFGLSDPESVADPVMREQLDTWRGLLKKETPIIDFDDLVKRLMEEKFFRRLYSTPDATEEERFARELRIPIYDAKGNRTDLEDILEPIKKARANKDYKTADEGKAKLEALGYKVEYKADGTISLKKRYRNE